MYSYLNKIKVSNYGVSNFFNSINKEENKLGVSFKRGGLLIKPNQKKLIDVYISKNHVLFEAGSSIEIKLVTLNGMNYVTTILLP